jgi:hypothetical protein
MTTSSLCLLIVPLSLLLWGGEALYPGLGRFAAGIALWIDILTWKKP